jgi:hypothetical protein
MNRKGKSNHWNGEVKHTNKRWREEGEEEEEEGERYTYQYQTAGNGSTGTFSVKSTHACIRDPYDDLDNLTGEELAHLKRSVKYLNPELTSGSEMDYLKNLCREHFETTVINEEEDLEERSEQLKILFNQFNNNNYGVLLNNNNNNKKRKSEKMKKIQPIIHKISNREERKLYESKVICNVPEMVMAPITYKICNKRYDVTNILTPVQQQKKNALDKERSSTESSHLKHQHKKQDEQKTSKEQLQEHISYSCFDAEHVTLIELIYLIELHTNAFLKSVILSIKELTFICVFEWDTEAKFVFLIGFRVTSKAFINMYKQSENGNNYAGDVLHLQRQDIFNDEDNEDDDKYFMVIKVSNIPQENLLKVLANGKSMSEELLLNLRYSTVSYLNYGYSLSTVKYLFK